MNLLKRIFSPTSLTISILLLIYTFYQSEIVWNSLNRSYYNYYYLISLILICFSTITFFINDKKKEYLIISVISLLFSLYLFEGYLVHQNLKELNYGFTLKKFIEKQDDNQWDKRGKCDIYKDLKKKNSKVTLSFRPSVLVDENHSTLPFPLSGLSNSETINCNENGYYQIYQSDRYGFNNLDKQWDENEIEYLLVGDSFVHGQCVNRPNDISSVLRNLSNKSVLNLGMSGNGPLIEYATLREYLNTNVKKVLWIYDERTDANKDIYDEKKNAILIKYLNDLNFTQNLKSKQNESDKFIINYLKKAEESFEKKRENKKKKMFIVELIKSIKLYNLRISIKPFKDPLPPKEFKQILELTKKLVEENNSKLYFVYLPELTRYIPSSRFDETTNNYNLIKNIVTEMKIPFIDIHKEVFEKEKNPLKLFPFEIFIHYNVEGYKKVSETIYKFTKD